ncbi:hypothetical protein [Haloarcula onubensis]|uniref:Uncharacterized protein n=1 Tax=Haloarcula onubensis TaxID=2950539 RepID=A0ABU2FPA1_9EURY|nr:hypothetical protein [Halomicroarcula sp. S3CR25-11]MDS0282122.1 hypothetical protein [Halomicroarcula sp. S3CR25-11]
MGTLGLAAVGGLAGCSSDGGERTATTTATATGTPVEPQQTETGDLPPYANFVPDTADLVLLTTFDLQVESGHRVGSPPETVRDPLRYSSMTAAYVGSLLELSVVAGESGLLAGSELPIADFGFESQRLDTSGVRRALTVGTVGVLELPVDLESAIADAEDGAGRVEFEAEDRAVIANPDGTRAGLTTDAVVFTPPTVDAESPERLRDIVDTRAGARPPKHEADDGFASLLANADATGSLACGYAPDGTVETLTGERASSSPVSLPTEGFGAATGAVFRIDLDNGDEPQPASGVMRFPEAASLDLEAATESVGSAAADRSVTTDGGTVRVTGAYSWDALSEFEGSLIDAL